jgi:hypothetical protein
MDLSPSGRATSRASRGQVHFPAVVSNARVDIGLPENRPDPGARGSRYNCRDTHRHGHKGMSVEFFNIEKTMYWPIDLHVVALSIIVVVLGLLLPAKELVTLMLVFALQQCFLGIVWHRMDWRKTRWRMILLHEVYFVVVTGAVWFLRWLLSI